MARSHAARHARAARGCFGRGARRAGQTGARIRREAGIARGARACGARPILAGLELKAEQAPSRWERFKRWLRDRFKQGDDKDERGWLDELLLDIRTSEGFARTLTWLGYGLVIGLSVYVIWGEMRAAGFLGGRRRD